MAPAVMKRKKTEYYVNNKEFLAAITDYRHKVHAAKEAGDPRHESPIILVLAF